MLNRIIDDINKALDAEAYMAALALVLTLPDICGRAEFPDEKSVGKRYIKWYDEYVGKYEKAPVIEGEDPMPYLSGEVVYQLRCAFLHQGNPNIDSGKIKDDQCKIDKFTLVYEKKNQFNIYTDASGLASGFLTGDKVVRSYRVNIRRLCLIMTLNARWYFNNNKEKFNFFNYDLLDWDEEIEKLHSLNGKDRD
ncbi:MAG: hypothetical protein ACTTIR_07960 [Eggerthia catenaformis]|uniref:hypothetical protein n=1 Tax=Eggerthia catenaformis TaxID=31973 RepID=UPI003FA1743E